MHHRWVIASCLLACLGVPLRLPAEPRCYLGGKDAVDNPASFEYYDAVLRVRPEAFFNAGSSWELRWEPQEGTHWATPDEIGSFQGKAIYRFIYRADTDAEHKNFAAPVWTLFAYRIATKSKEQRFTPFCLILGQVEASFVSGRTYPFGLRVVCGPNTRAEARNGYFSAYLFTFSATQVHLAEREEDWHGKSQIIRYGRSGKLLNRQLLAAGRSF